MRRRFIAAAAAAALLLSGCSADDGGSEKNEAGEGGGSDLTFAMVTHSAPGDAFWDIVKSGGEDAAEVMGVELTYQADPDPAQQSILISNAIAQDVDGLIISMANPDGLEEAVKEAVAAGIPVITINSGIDYSQDFGAMTHVGQSESLAGKAAGEEFAKAGKTKMVCVIHEAGNIGQEERCSGAEEAFGGEFETLQVDIADLTSVQNTIAAKLQSEPDIDAVFTLNGSVTTAALGAIEEAGSEAMIGGIDMDAEVVAAIEDGRLAFAIDQQPYAQGWLPVVFLHQKVVDAMEVGGGQPVFSGPMLVTKDNVADIADATTRGKH